MTERRLREGGDAAAPVWNLGDPPEADGRLSRRVLWILALVGLVFVALAAGIGVVVPTLDAEVDMEDLPAVLCGEGEVPEDLTTRPGRWLAVWCR